jgi:8-oxo-dGTP pyrophosphatase MutT (NUDIX family)
MVTVPFPLQCKSDAPSWRNSLSPNHININNNLSCSYESFKNKRKNNNCGICIISNDAKYCLMVFQRKAKKWSFPKGSKELGETNIICMKRELYEETGIDLNNLYYNLICTIRKYQYYLYVIKLKENHDSIILNPQDKKEIELVKWVKISDALNFNMNRITEDIIFDLQKNNNLYNDL